MHSRQHPGNNPKRQWASQVPDRPLDTRRPLSPRKTRPLHMPVASWSILASPSLGGWPSPLFISGPNSVHACALRLASCDNQGFIVPVTRTTMLSHLHVHRQLHDRTFHSIRTVRLRLTHQSAQRKCMSPCSVRSVGSVLNITYLGRHPICCVSQHHTPLAVLRMRDD